MAKPTAEKLQRVRRLARRLGIDGRIEISPKRDKKFVAVGEGPGGRDVHFGHPDYDDFLDHRDPERRRRYLARARGIRDGAGKLTWRRRSSPNFWSVHLLW